MKPEFVNTKKRLLLPRFFSNPELFFTNKPPGRVPPKTFRRLHRFALGHMALNVMSNPPIFLGQVAKYSLRNGLYEVSRRG